MTEKESGNTASPDAGNDFSVKSPDTGDAFSFENGSDEPESVKKRSVPESSSVKDMKAEREEIEKFPEIIKIRNRQKAARIGKLFLGIMTFRPVITGFLIESGYSERLMQLDFSAEEIVDMIIPPVFLFIWLIGGNYKTGYAAAFVLAVSVAVQFTLNPWQLSLTPLINGYAVCIGVIIMGAHSQGTVERMKGLFKGLV